jgi:hypothetical protein
MNAHRHHGRHIQPRQRRALFRGQGKASGEAVGVGTEVGPRELWPWPRDADDTFLPASQHSEDTVSGYIHFRKLTQRALFGMYLERCHVVQHHFQARVG